MGPGEDINRKEFARAFLLRAKADLKSAKDLLERHWIRPRYPFPETGDIWNPLEEYEEEDAKEAIEKAEFVFERLKALLKERYGLVTE